MKTTEEKNRMIAEFMGMKPCDDEGVVDGWWTNTIPAHDYQAVMLGGMKFHTSWDWLMPVIRKLNEDVISSIQKTDYINKISSFCLVDDIEACHYTVIQFIEWYNEQKL